MHCSIPIALDIVVSKCDANASAIGDHGPDLHRHPATDPRQPHAHSNPHSHSHAELEGYADAQPEPLYPGRLASLQEGAQLL